MSDADFIVIGSGPAGVSAALPLAQAGHRVLLLDGADSYELAPASNTERMLGGMLEGLSAEDGLSPKFRTPLARRILSRFAEANGISSENFVGVGALARGGLSRVWGAFVTEFADRDFAGWPIGLQDLAPSYARVCERIGVNGTGGDTVGGELGQSGPLQPPLPLGAAATLLLGRYRPDGKGLKLGLARNAVLSAAHDGRSACDLRNACLWGCPIGAIYDARQDLARLQAHANFRLVDRCLPAKNRGRLAGAGRRRPAFFRAPPPAGGGHFGKLAAGGAAAAMPRRMAAVKQSGDGYAAAHTLRFDGSAEAQPQPSATGIFPHIGKPARGERRGV